MKFVPTTTAAVSPGCDKPKSNPGLETALDDVLGHYMPLHVWHCQTVAGYSSAQPYTCNNILTMQESFNNFLPWQKNCNVLVVAGLLPPYMSLTTKKKINHIQPPNSCSGVAFTVVVLGITSGTDASTGTDVFNGLSF